MITYKVVQFFKVRKARANTRIHKWDDTIFSFGLVSSLLVHILQPQKTL